MMGKIDCVIAEILLIEICFLPRNKRDKLIREVVDKINELQEATK